MHLGITGDTDIRSGLGQVIDDWAGPARQNFLARNYGVGILGIVVVLMCQDPALNLKQRVRLVKKGKKLYIDLMLDLNEMERITNLRVKKKTVAERMVNEISAVLKKYSILDFDATCFIHDLKNWFENNV